MAGGDVTTTRPRMERRNNIIIGIGIFLPTRITATDLERNTSIDVRCVE